jgi:putative hemolysin
MSANIGFEAGLIFLLILANGVFAMSELAVVSARRARLQQRANEGDSKALAALTLATHPNEFLSTVQVGITLISTLAGAFGGATIASKVALSVKGVPLLAPHADTISITLVVFIISYLSLIIGELVPKRIALNNPEAIATAIARPMRMIAKIASPAVRFLTWSTNLVLKLLPVKSVSDTSVTAEEVTVLLQQGTESGAFEPAEKAMIEGVFRLGDRTVEELMTPRLKVAFLNVNDDLSTVQAKIEAVPHSRFPVAEGNNLDKVLGVVHIKDLFRSTDKFDLRSAIRKPAYVPESTPALSLLKLFQESGIHIALVLNEHGGVQGILTLTDIMQAIVGDLPDPGEAPSLKISPRGERSWIVDGSLLAEELRQLLRVPELPGEEEAGFSTVGGFLMHNLERVPAEGDQFTFDSYRFKVHRMDGNRVDKVLVEDISADT